MSCKSKRHNCPCTRCTLGWYSRRHETRDAQDAAREAYKTRAQRRPAQMWDEALKCWRIKYIADARDAA